MKHQKESHQYCERQWSSRRQTLFLFPGDALERAQVHPDARSVFQSALIHYAARNGRYAVVDKLLDAGADIQLLDFGGLRRTALHLACQGGHVRTVETLVRRGADTSCHGENWATLIGGVRCGSLIDTRSPTELTPSQLCSNQLVRLALERTRWAPGNHKDWPLHFRMVVRTLLMVAYRHGQNRILLPSPGQPPVNPSFLLPGCAKL